ncbi:MAG: glucose-6-phosphate isomerase [Firmicutes bacterium]|nr:glucose-6-phosphate isomerase [Bacillota bacterium]
MDIKVNIAETGIEKEEIDKLKTRIDDEYKKLCSGKTDFTDWVKLPFAYDEKEIESVLTAAEEIKEKSDILIVIGIGGSYLGTRAVTEAVGARGSIGLPAKEADGTLASWIKDGVHLIFAGNNLSASYHLRILRELLGNDVCLCVVSKSGETTETKAAFAMLKSALETKYSEEEARNRIYAVTGKDGNLRQEAEKEGYTVFDIAENIGGRYSVLTPAGLLPISAAGPDIKELLAGAKAAAEAAASDPSFFDYAAVRYLLGQEKTTEVFEYYEPQLTYFVEWLKQLFGESEGKDGKGVFPVSMSMSTDLHSMGQFLQEGRQCFFETVLNVESPTQDFTVPNSAGTPLAGRSMNYLNDLAMNSVIKAHRDSGVPIVKIDIPELTPYFIGQLIYFFEINCAVCCGLFGVNAFDQPGVENYKNEMKKGLK